MAKIKRVHLDSMRPTQVCVGLQEVEAKEWEILQIKKGDLDAWLEKHPIPAVLSPDNKLYLIDHHHLGLALWRLSERYSYEHKRNEDNPFINCYFTVVRDFSESGLNQVEFMKCMEAIGMLYPYDEFGKRTQVTSIPRHIADLKDDPYRSLAGFCRKAGAFEKADVPYTEFKWANYFRDRIPVELIRSDVQKAIAKGVELAHSDPECQSLPGYKTPESGMTFDI